MTSIPDSVNINDLTELLATAKQEEEIHAEDNDEKEFTPEFIMELATKMSQEILETCPSPTAHKAVMVVMLKKMIDWHTNMGAAMFEDGNDKAGVCWLRDAGKFQAMWDILHQICLGDDDFLCDND